MALFGTVARSRTAILFDVGSGSVGVAIVISEENAPAPRLLYTYRSELVFSEEQTYERLVCNTQNAFLEAMVALLRDGMPILKRVTGRDDVDTIRCIYAAPWILPDSKILSVTKDKPFVVTKERIDLLVEKAEEQFVRNTAGATLIEKMVTDVILNGYHSDSPYGNKVKDLKIAVFASVLATELMEKLEKQIRKSFAHPTIGHHSFALASFTALRDAITDISNYLLVDIAGEVSDIVIVHSRMLEKIVSIPHGRRPFIRTVANIQKTTPKEAESAIKMVAEGSRTAESLSPALSHAREDFTKTCVDAFSGIEAEHPLPSDIYVSADEDVIAHFKECLEAAGRGARVKAIDAAMLAPLVRIEAAAHNDIFLGIGARFFHKLQHAR